MPVPGAANCINAWSRGSPESGNEELRLKELLPQFEQRHQLGPALGRYHRLSRRSARRSCSSFLTLQNVINTVLADFIGRPTVLVRPILIWARPARVSPSSHDKSAECLRVFCWRTDASRCRRCFSGTDRRWSSAEPCHPFLAIVRARHANPMVLLDELDKPSSAGNRADVGRLWDCLLELSEVGDQHSLSGPLFQTNVDLSQISYLATANSVAGLPRPLLDRMRVINLPLPSRDHLDALLPAGHRRSRSRARSRCQLVATLDGEEHAAILSAWNGGSVRNLRRLVEVILRDRDANATRN